VREFVASLVRLARTEIKVNSRRTEGITNLPYLVGSNDKLREKANWVPEIPLEKSLRDALDEGRRRAAPTEAVAAAAEDVAGERQR
jgi:GDP-4-dehydro-6-deoxy-D-mannose reductase